MLSSYELSKATSEQLESHLQQPIITTLFIGGAQSRLKVLKSQAATNNEMESNRLNSIELTLARIESAINLNDRNRPKIDSSKWLKSLASEQNNPFYHDDLIPAILRFLSFPERISLLSVSTKIEKSIRETKFHEEYIFFMGFIICVDQLTDKAISYQELKTHEKIKEFINKPDDLLHSWSESYARAEDEKLPLVLQDITERCGTARSGDPFIDQMNSCIFNFLKVGMPGMAAALLFLFLFKFSEFVVEKSMNISNATREGIRAAGSICIFTPFFVSLFIFAFLQYLQCQNKNTAKNIGRRFFSFFKTEEDHESTREMTAMTEDELENDETSIEVLPSNEENYTIYGSDDEGENEHLLTNMPGGAP